MSLLCIIHVCIQTDYSGKSTCMHIKCREYACIMHGTCMEYISAMHGICLYHAWNYAWYLHEDQSMNVLGLANVLKIMTIYVG